MRKQQEMHKKINQRKRMTTTSNYRSLVLLFALQLTASIIFAQEPGKKQTIDITSSFKPVLRNSAKLNFNAAPPPVDTSRPRLNYQIPVQNIIPGLQPIALKPLSYTIDSNSSWANSNFIKAGFGNLQTPYVKAGFSLGDQNTRFNIFADHISSKGKIDNQDYSQTGVKGHLYTAVGNNLEFHAKAGFNQDKYFQYGYDKGLYNFTKDDLLRRYSTISGEAGLRNLAPTEFGLGFRPVLKLNVFADNRKNNETNAVLDAPLEKIVGEAMSIKLGFNADMTRYKPDNADAINNNIFTIPVAVLFKTPNLNLHAGGIPSWDNGKFKLLPDLRAEFPIADEKWIIQAGWLGYYNKGSYQRFASINPYLSAPTSLKNTRMTEVYGGFKGILFEKFTYNAKVGGVEFSNLPLFINDKGSGRTFDIVYEERLRALQIQAELGYIQAETFSLQAGLNIYNFNKQRTKTKPYGLIPIEFSGHLRWKIIKDLWLKTDLFMWDGAFYEKQDNSIDRLPGAFDLNAGLEFRITKKLMLWAQFNNITNSKYQRWSQYDVYGFNMLGGVTFSFAQ
jgi:hypothetical protein